MTIVKSKPELERELNIAVTEWLYPPDHNARMIAKAKINSIKSLLKEMEAPAEERTGAPGRPPAAYLVDPEAKRRRESREVLKSLTAEAKALLDWYKQRYPEGPPLTAKTIENRFRSEHQSYWARPQN